jgi:molybdopterin synthase sulfur carrier subunit
MKIGFFGRLAERLGREIDFDLPEGACSITALRRQLAQQFPSVAADFNSGSLRACVDEQIVPDSYMVGPGQRIEFFPPLSGG